MRGWPVAAVFASFAGLVLASCSSGVPAATTTHISQLTTTSATSTTTTIPPTTTTTVAPTTVATTTTSPSPTASITGYGATLSVWTRAHPRNGSYQGLPSYGPTVTTPEGPTPQFITLNASGGWVNFFIESIPAMTITAAKAQVMDLLPSATVVDSFVVAHDTTGDSCAFWNLASPTLAGAGRGGVNGEVVVEMGYDDTAGAPSYRPDEINTLSFEEGANPTPTGTC